MDLHHELTAFAVRRAELIAPRERFALGHHVNHELFERPGNLTTPPIHRLFGVYSTTLDTAKLPWTALDFPGVSMRVIHEDKKSGSMTVMTRLEPGASIPAHIHTKADETVFVVSGDFIEDEVAYGPGNFFAAPAGSPHGPHRSRTGCIVLTTFSALLDFQIVGAPHAA